MFSISFLLRALRSVLLCSRIAGVRCKIHPVLLTHTPMPRAARAVRTRFSFMRSLVGNNSVLLKTALTHIA